MDQVINNKGTIPDIAVHEDDELTVDDPLIRDTMLEYGKYTGDELREGMNEEMESLRVLMCTMNYTVNNYPMQKEHMLCI